MSDKASRKTIQITWPNGHQESRVCDSFEIRAGCLLLWNGDAVNGIPLPSMREFYAEKP